VWIGNDVLASIHTHRSYTYMHTQTHRAVYDAFNLVWMGRDEGSAGDTDGGDDQGTMTIRDLYGIIDKCEYGHSFLER
jgi:hypothetical protein